MSRREEPGFPSEPSPRKDWPQWLREAETEGAEVRIDRDVVTWEGGIWKKGTWKGGIWKDGTWMRGIWEGGIWMRGTWKGGIWKDGIWWDGTWKDGTWMRGIWKKGTWMRGTWMRGTWMRGTPRQPLSEDFYLFPDSIEHNLTFGRPGGGFGVCSACSKNRATATGVCHECGDTT